MPRNEITRADAEAVCEAVVAHFVSEIISDMPSSRITMEGFTAAFGAPTILEDFDGARWVLSWEEGPEDFAYRTTEWWSYNVSERPDGLEGIFLEAQNHCNVSLHLT